MLLMDSKLPKSSLKEAMFLPTGELKRVKGYDKAFILGKTDAVTVLGCVKPAEKIPCHKI